MNPSNFPAELKRRNVYKVAIAYGVVAWLLLQAASILFPTFEAPPWTMKVFVAVIALGFPIALIIAWAFELTPEGLKRTEDVDLAARPRGKRHAWIYIVIVGAAFSIGLFGLGRYTAENKTRTVNDTSNKSIAVLPFVDLSQAKDQEYFCDGISEEILDALAKVE